MALLYSPLSSHFLNFLCCMKLGETVTYCGLEGVSLCRRVLYSLCVPSAFGRRAGFDVNTSHDFPRCAGSDHLGSRWA